MMWKFIVCVEVPLYLMNFSTNELLRIELKGLTLLRDPLSKSNFLTQVWLYKIQKVIYWDFDDEHYTEPEEINHRCYWDEYPMSTDSKIHSISNLGEDCIVVTHSFPLYSKDGGTGEPSQSFISNHLSGSHTLYEKKIYRALSAGVCMYGVLA